MSFLFSSLFGGKPEGPHPSFEEWLATTTQADVEELFLHVLKEGDAEDGLGRSLSREEVAHFDRIVSSTAGDSTLSPSTSISPAAVITHLTECHPRHAKAISSSSDLLTTLLQAHASFPFPTSAADSLTPPALLRAVTLLTGNSEKLLGAAGSIGDAVTIRKRTPNQRVAFIFSSLASPPASPSVDDVVDVLCRVPYPRVKDRSTGDLRRRNIVDLTPAAERLLEQDAGKKNQDPVEASHVPAAVYHQLTHLVASLNGNSAVEGLGQGQTDIDVGTFDKWAVEANLLGALDKLFASFLRKT